MNESGVNTVFWYRCLPFLFPWDLPVTDYSHGGCCELIVGGWVAWFSKGSAVSCGAKPPSARFNLFYF